MRVGLFVTCLVDLMRPSIGFAAIELLESGGADVYVPASQTCCGQPCYNSGDRADTVALARKVIEEFEDCDYLVAPSGSCAGYPAKSFWLASVVTICSVSGASGVGLPLRPEEKSPGWSNAGGKLPLACSWIQSQ